MRRVAEKARLEGKDAIGAAHEVLIARERRDLEQEEKNLRQSWMSARMARNQQERNEKAKEALEEKFESMQGRLRWKNEQVDRLREQLEEREEREESWRVPEGPWDNCGPNEVEEANEPEYSFDPHRGRRSWRAPKGPYEGNGTREAYEPRVPRYQ